jgi:hypothetical protein
METHVDGLAHPDRAAAWSWPPWPPSGTAASRAAYSAVCNASAWSRRRRDRLPGRTALWQHEVVKGGNPRIDGPFGRIASLGLLLGACGGEADSRGVTDPSSSTTSTTATSMDTISSGERGDTTGEGSTGGPDTAAATGDDDTGDSGEIECEQPEFHGAAPPLVELGGECDRLSYGLYANHGQDEALHRLPDYSFAGYMKGGIALPTAPVVVVLGPEPGDDHARIQQAIDEVGAAPLGADGLRGAVLLTQGTYDVGDTLTIAASGVVLRGEGQGSNGTILRATKPEQHDFLRIQGTGSGLGEVEGSRVDITSNIVPVGARTFEVASAAGFEVGDVVGVLRTPNQAWIDALQMGQWGWTVSSYAIAHERTIVAIDGDEVTVDIPIVDTIEDQYGGGALFRADLSGRVAQVGVESLRIESIHSGPTDEDHGWIAVRLHRATNSWVRRVTAVHFGYAAVSMHAQSSFNTVEDTAMLEPISQITGGRRYSFNVSGGVGNLFQRCFSEASRHDFVTGSRVTGPHVWLDCLSVDSHSDDGPHHRWATGLLFDNTMGRMLHVENRQSSGTGHGWSGAQVLFWNGLAEGIRCDTPLGAMNWLVGSVGAKNEGGWAPDEPFGWWESHNGVVHPRSLYLQQLRDRLGPDAVEAVTLPEQRDGRIWARLAGWRGEGRIEDATPVAGDPDCDTGIISGISCCAASCGSCGGAGCGSLPGGAASCCTGHVTTSGRSCLTHPPPCILSDL